MNDCGCASYNRLTRRRFLGAAGGFGAAGFFGLLDPRILFAQTESGAAAKSVIFLWMAGGQSHLDTWDPKPGTDNGGPFAAIDTAVKGIQICEHLPLIAREFADISLIRSLTGREGNHERAAYQFHTGYVPLGSIQHSSLGSVAAKQLGDPKADIPPYVSINGNSWPAGHLGAAYASFHIGSGTDPVKNLDFHSSITPERFRTRLKLLQKFDRTFSQKHKQEEVIQAYAEHYEAAYRLMKSPSARAFDLAQEKEAVRESYGVTSFGQGCLLARRLVQVGVRFIEVSLGGWDTHTDNFERIKELSGETMDRAVASLIADLRAKDLLATTMVVLCTEFGRTPMINGNTGRDHWPRVFSAALAGGGIKGGRVVGTSADDGTEVKDRPVQIDELQATIFTQLGIDHTRKNTAPDGRPIRILERKEVQPVAELLS